VESPGGEGDFDNNRGAHSEASSVGFPCEVTGESDLICRKSLRKCSGISGLGGMSADSIGTCPACRPLVLGRLPWPALEEARE